MKKKHKWWIGAGVLASVLVLAAAAVGPIMSNVEQAKYTVAERHGDIEIRDYLPMIVAQAEVAGPRDRAISDGFRIIADYIFGNNIAAREIEMTAPLIQQEGRSIAMTAPVTQQGDGRTWRIRFIMPSNYTMETLPIPKNPAVQIREIASKRFAAIRFSGLPNDEKLAEQAARLESFVAEKNRRAILTPTYAFYNPPWTLPFLRRNEVLIEISTAS